MEDHSRQQSQAQEGRPFDHPRGVTLALRAAANGKVSKNVRARSIIIIIIRARLGRLQSSKLNLRSSSDRKSGCGGGLFCDLAPFFALLAKLPFWQPSGIGDRIGGG